MRLALQQYINTEQIHSSGLYLFFFSANPQLLSLNLNMVDLSHIQQAIDNFNKVPFLKIPLNFVKRVMLAVLKTGPLPAHIGLIMDGNRRFAKQQGLKLEEGHTAGAQSLAEVSTNCCK